VTTRLCLHCSKPLAKRRTETFEQFATRTLCSSLCSSKLRHRHHAGGIPRLDLLGERKGRLRILHRVPRPADAKDSAAWWLTRCDCGKEEAFSAKELAHWRRSCGCGARNRRQSLVGRRVGRLVVESESGDSAVWRCDCGAARVMLRSSIQKGRVPTCGCEARVEEQGERKGCPTCHRVADVGHLYCAECRRERREERRAQREPERMRRCGECGERGHNARGCERRAA
jgi:hypothetical protein